MPSRRDGRIEPGQPLRSAISASAWNRAQDAADLVLGQRPRFGAEAGAAAQSPYTAVVVKNTTANDLPRWGVLGITGIDVAPSAGPQFEAMPVLSGGVPTATTNEAFGIAVEPIRAGGYGRFAVAGVVQVRLEVTTGSDTAAGPKSGSVAELRTGGVGAAVLWRESGTGANRWALVRLGGGGGGGGTGVRLGTISATWTKGGTATVAQQNGDGTARTGNPTFTASNYFATVTVPSGQTRRVACALIDSTWALIAAECA